MRENQPPLTTQQTKNITNYLLKLFTRKKDRRLLTYVHSIKGRHVELLPLPEKNRFQGANGVKEGAFIIGIVSRDSVFPGYNVSIKVTGWGYKPDSEETMRVTVEDYVSVALEVIDAQPKVRRKKVHA